MAAFFCLYREEKHSLQWRHQSLSVLSLNLLPPFSALTSLHLSLSSLPSPSSNPWYEVIARVEWRTSNRGWNPHIHTSTHIHISCCVYIEHIPLSESSPNLQSHWLFLSPIHKVRQINGRKKDCLDHPPGKVLSGQCSHCSVVWDSLIVHIQTFQALQTIGFSLASRKLLNRAAFDPHSLTYC